MTRNNNNNGVYLEQLIIRLAVEENEFLTTAYVEIKAVESSLKCLRVSTGSETLRAQRKAKKWTGDHPPPAPVVATRKGLARVSWSSFRRRLWKSPTVAAAGQRTSEAGTMNVSRARVSAKQDRPLVRMIGTGVSWHTYIGMNIEPLGRPMRVQWVRRCCVTKHNRTTLYNSTFRLARPACLSESQARRRNGESASLEYPPLFTSSLTAVRGS